MGHNFSLSCLCIEKKNTFTLKNSSPSVSYTHVTCLKMLTFYYFRGLEEEKVPLQKVALSTVKPSELSHSSDTFDLHCRSSRFFPPNLKSMAVLFYLHF